ncbi:HAMP domain-containing histidine kinase [bacterium]|nr:HAMP domain-containing histidine kinase [bacterium]
MPFFKRVLYQHVGTFKGVLFLAAVVLIVSVLVYSQYLVSALKESTRRSLAQKISTYSALIRSDNPELIGFALEQIQDVDFPIIVTDNAGNPKFWKNVGVRAEPLDESARESLKKLLREMDAQGNTPLPIIVGVGQSDWFHYGDSVVIRQLRWLPWIEIAAAALFVIVGYSGFQSIRRSEERMVWVGLAKETAHQLGTPITSILGWIALLKSEGAQSHALEEMERDLARLNRVTARFSQIGSQTSLTPVRVRNVIEETVDYFRQRLPQSAHKVSLTAEFECDPLLGLNVELFSWVLENLIRNSIDAMRSSSGSIKLVCSEKGEWTYIDVTDTGCGISPKNRRDVFRPGFTTKKRGWGLGLSLAQRIVEEYHGGKLFIKESAPGKGTTMRIAMKTHEGAIA